MEQALELLIMVYTDKQEERDPFNTKIKNKYSPATLLENFQTHLRRQLST